MSKAIAQQAHLASTVLKTLSDEQRSLALYQIKQGLEAAKEDILAANRKDMEVAETNKLSSSLIKRLDLSKNGKFDSMCEGVLDVSNLEDPLNRVTLATELDDGLTLTRLTCPVGVLLIIFESRPEVIANITALAIKSGNAAILKGGKESLHTFQAMAKVINKVLQDTAVPKNAIQLISTREEVGDLLKQDKYIDLVIPRGSNELVRNIKENTKIPVLGHADGICSIFVDKAADLAKACRIIVDAKTNYPAGCNAVETVLLHSQLVQDGSHEKVLQALREAGVTCHLSAELFKDQPQSVLAEDSDFSREFLSLDVAVKSVASVEEAILHINEHSSKHTDCIVTEDKEAAEKFLAGIDSAGVYWNCSTRFADGFRYGFGTEVGISTNKIHARGPVGLEGLVCYYYQLRGNGQVAGDYRGAGGTRVFKHKKLNI
ncbi:hypothetical protein KL905_003883 [Ogataea polymorpha]|uniref:glutamate-5-semialdehyde dehydrogenase n=1 Tax=Ogataea polymorpha TaxID=460523 RepID=A0A1B7SFJ2_9ASCO|nr:uncharacterized protein OGAPODRAFT_16996 [Ogataea polymorpha]KAG7878275.1 hypothetical protein KL937_004017 [Ogataea polymorpha]KAG7890208.1 hypothetical protein KL908_004546 [Ogataea polymorpha]KAG7895408.1 hypothetical protein KL936_000116 [Ogataea polymorpha]KAG7898630.1 hypothetical protein KL935_004229 [Ogataea polymorpha]KAG7901598.1 hypothetical protein KL907_004268 [Ogataea polymorpha]